MKNTQHTSGPWNSHQPGFKGLVSGIVRDQKNRFIANANTPDTGEYIRDENEIDANARLIAAAPEILEALINLKKWCVQNTPAITVEMLAAESAIQKATQ